MAKMITEGFRIAKYMSKIESFAYDLMRQHAWLKNHPQDGEFDPDEDLYYMENFFRLGEEFPSIEVRIYEDEDGKVSFEGCFDESYKRGKNIQGLICLFVNSSIQRTGNEILDSCIVYLKHELTHFLDYLRNQKIGRSNEHYLDAPDDNNWLGLTCYVLLNETEWNAWQEEYYNNPQGLEDEIKRLDSRIKSLETFEFDTPKLDEYLREIMTTVFQKDYSHTPTPILKAKLLNTLKLKFKKFVTHSRRKMKQCLAQPSDTTNKAAIQNLGKQLIDIILGKYDSYEEKDYGNKVIYTGKFTFNGNTYHVTITKNAYNYSYQWQIKELGNESFGESDMDFYDAIYDDDITVVDEINIGTKAYNLLSAHQNF